MGSISDKPWGAVHFDPMLLDKLVNLPDQPFEGIVHRATRLNADPATPSNKGGRWGPPSNGDDWTFILYTSLEGYGALAEFCAFLAGLTPVPGPRLIKVTELDVAL